MQIAQAWVAARIGGVASVPRSEPCWSREYKQAEEGHILQAAADWQKVARLPYAQQLLASEPGQAALQRTLGMSADAMRNMLAWRVWRWSA